MGMQGSKSLVAGYSFENTGADIMGVNPIIFTGATYGDGVSGQCSIFDGVDDFGTFANEIPFSVGTSISFWWNNPAEVSKNSAIFGHATLNTLSILYNNYGKILNIVAGAIAYFSYAIPLTWFHFCISRRTASEYDLYVNTEFIGTAASGTTTIDIKYFGRRSGGRYIKSDFDLLKFHNKLLTKQDLQRDYLNLPIF